MRTAIARRLVAAGPAPARMGVACLHIAATLRCWAHSAVPTYFLRQRRSDHSKDCGSLLGFEKIGDRGLSRRPPTPHDGAGQRKQPWPYCHMTYSHTDGTLCSFKFPPKWHKRILMPGIVRWHSPPIHGLMVAWHPLSCNVVSPVSLHPLAHMHDCSPKQKGHANTICRIFCVQPLCPQQVETPWFSYGPCPGCLLSHPPDLDPAAAGERALPRRHS